jgi:hypothetical protein
MRIRALVLAVAAPALLHAQYPCKPPASSNEARLLAFFAGPLGFAAVPEVIGLARGQISIAGDLTLVPSPPSAISRSSGICGFSKSENSELAPVFPRPRVAVGLGAGVTAEASYLPPVTVADATPNLVGVALSWTPANLALPGAMRLHLRAHGTFGGVKGPVTCARNALQQSSASQPCYGTTPSKDTYNPNVRGVEAILSRPSGALSWYAGVGMNALTSHFKVDFTDQRGFRDNNTVDIDLTRVALMAGASWSVRPAIALSAQLYSVPDDATTARLGIAWRAR